MENLPRLARHLRDATAAAHRLLDHHPLLAVLTGRQLSLPDYARALAALHGAQGAIERHLSDFAPQALFPPRLPDLEADLEALGSPPYRLTIPFPAPSTAAAKVGWMYVIEGSNLGGAVIARQLKDSLPAGVPLRFFAGAAGRVRWAGFWSFVQDYCPDNEIPQAAEAACTAFAFYRDHLDSVLTG